MRETKMICTMCGKEYLGEHFAVRGEPLELIMQKKRLCKHLLEKIRNSRKKKKKKAFRIFYRTEGF